MTQPDEQGLEGLGIDPAEIVGPHAGQNVREPEQGFALTEMLNGEVGGGGSVLLPSDQKAVALSFMGSEALQPLGTVSNTA